MRSSGRLPSACALLGLMFGLPATGFGATSVPSLLPERATPSVEALVQLRHVDGYWQVWLCQPDGTGAEAMTTSPVDKLNLSCAGSTACVNTSQGQALLIDLGTGESTPLELGDVRVTDASISADGKRIAYSAALMDTSDTNCIWLLDRETQDREMLTREAVLQHEPAFGPQGQSLVFLEGAGGNDHNVVLLDLKTRERVYLTAQSNYHFDPVLVSAGKLAVSSNRTGDYEIWLLDIHGAEAPVQLTDSPGLDSEPAFSRDGQRMAFASARAGILGIYVADLGGGEPRRASPDNVPARNPVWTHLRQPALPDAGKDSNP